MVWPFKEKKRDSAVEIAQNQPQQPMDKQSLQNNIIDALKTIYDPEIPVDVYELGLIYEVKVDDEGNAFIMMTLTSPSCPVAESLPAEVEQKAAAVDGISSAKVEIVFDPPWSQDMMSEAAKLDLGFL
jgi:FeS assembly SUF system protein